jgi:uncharacterized protein YodC (DUF2158 family)
VNNFRRGQLVCVRSGGPKMTVSTIGKPLVFCVWFDDAGVKHDEGFEPETLEPWEEREARETRHAREWDNRAEEYDPLV